MQAFECTNRAGEGEGTIRAGEVTISACQAF